MPVDIQEELSTIRSRLLEEATVAGKYGTGAWAFFRSAMDEFSQKGMRNRIFLVFCAFTLSNLSGASGMFDLQFSFRKLI